MEALLQDKNLKRICILILLSLWAWSVFGGTTMPGDSLGLKTVEGKSFIVYQISAGETAYAVSRKYGIPFKEIAAANPGVDLGALKTGQTILVPSPVASAPTATPAVQTAENSSAKTEINTVQESPAETTNPAPPNSTEQTNTTVDVQDAVVDKGSSFAMIYGTYQSQNMIAMNEKGAATWIENNGIESGGDRFYALCNSAPIGSVIKVRNMMNNRIVYAKVIGRLSESEVNAKVLVKLSAGAGERLNVLDNRFVVEISYYISEETKSNE